MRHSANTTSFQRYPSYPVLLRSMLAIRGAFRRLPSEHRFLCRHRPSAFGLPLNRLQPNLSLAQHLSFSSNSASVSSAMMDEKIKQHYLADSPPTVVRLEIKSHFDNLTDPKLRKYAHYMSRFDSLHRIRSTSHSADLLRTPPGPLLKVPASPCVKSHQSRSPSMI